MSEKEIQNGIEDIVSSHPNKRIARNYAMQLDMVVFQRLMKEGKIH